MNVEYALEFVRKRKEASNPYSDRASRLNLKQISSPSPLKSSEHFRNDIDFADDSCSFCSDAALLCQCSG